MAGIGGIEWGYCSACCKEVPIVKAVKGAMLEDHSVMVGDQWRMEPVSCEGSFSEPGSAPTAEVERYAFQVPDEMDEGWTHDEASYYARVYGAPHAGDTGCGCPMRGGVHAALCDAVADDEGPEAPSACTCGRVEGSFHGPDCEALTRLRSQAEDLTERIEETREAWARMLAGVTSSARIDQATISRCATAGPHPLGTYPNCGDYRGSTNCGASRRGASADLVIVDEINDIPQRGPFADQDARDDALIGDASEGRPLQRTGPSPIANVIAEICRGPEVAAFAVPHFFLNGPTRVEINGVELPGVIEMEEG